MYDLQHSLLTTRQQMDSPEANKSNTDYELRYRSFKKGVIQSWIETNEKLLFWLHHEASLIDLLFVQKLCSDTNAQEAFFELGKIE
jgi:hypothetical protein